MRPLADDAHAGGQVPVRVSFESGAVVYKPRPVDAGIALYTVLERLDEYLETPSFDAPGYLPRASYGWMSLVRYREPETAAAVERYYQRAGVLLCVAYVLDMPDCQYENLVAAGEQPTLVDAETVLHPHVDPGASTYETAALAASIDSVLRTALLPWDVGDVDDYEMGLPKSSFTAGLGSGSESTKLDEISKPVVRAVNTDVMSVHGESPTVDRTTNTVSVDGTDHPPHEYVETIVEAFRHAYETIRERHRAGAFRSEIVDRECVAGVENRIVARSTGIYRSIHRLGVARDPLRDGARLSAEFERLAAPFFDGQADSDRYWPLYAAERRSLRQRDVPRFTAQTDDTEIRHDGTPTGVDADRAGYNRLRDRLETMDDAELEKQCWLIRRSLEESPPNPAPPSGSVAVTDTRLEEEAIRYGEATIDAAVETEPSYQWASYVGVTVPQLCVSPADNTLYDGRAGIGLAAAAMYDRTGEGRFRDCAIDALDAVAADRGPDPTEYGGLKGTGSIVYALSVASTLLDRPAYRDRATEYARTITPAAIEADEALDVVDGTAGVLLAVLAHYDRFGDDEVIERAIACGDRLLEARSDGPDDPPWPVPGGDPEPGIAHGSSGIAYALARLAATVGEGRYERAARETFADESTRLKHRSPGGRTPSDAERIPDQWCRGRTGRAMARLGAGSALEDDDLLADANELLDASLAAEFNRYDHLCCGSVGQAISLLEATRRTDREIRDAKTVAGRCLHRRDRRGELSMPGHGHEVTNPTLFNGTSGVGYAMLRLREPDALPCVLLLE